MQKERNKILRQLGKYIQYLLQCGYYKPIDMVRKLKANDSHSGESRKQNTHKAQFPENKLKVLISAIFLKILILSFIHFMHFRKIPFKKVRGF